MSTLMPSSRFLASLPVLPVALLTSLLFSLLLTLNYEQLNDDAFSYLRAAERFGFTVEGLFRQHMVRKGRNRDTAWFAIIDGDWPAVRDAFQRWLAADNFDAEGQQKQRLEDLRK